MKIISGKYKNQNLKSFPGQNVRPTSAIVKKSVFQILEPFNGKKVLDLFAGIGSLGIESLSRGALSATFIEKNKKVFDFLSHNMNKICQDDNYDIINKDVYSYIKDCPQKYDIIFADPPYETADFHELKLKIIKLLNYKGIFCMERRFKNDIYEDVRIKNYGKTQILIWEKITQ